MNFKGLAIAIVAAGSCSAHSNSVQAREKVTVCFSHSADAAIETAQSMASKMFGPAGIDLEWLRTGKGCAIVIDLLKRTPKDADGSAMARAFVYEGVHIEVFEDKVSSKIAGVDSVLMAHVLVHEITHILEGISRHSATGVMKAQWSREDFARMHYSAMAFAPEDVELIQMGMLQRRTAGCESVCSLAVK